MQPWRNELVTRFFFAACSCFFLLGNSWAQEARRKILSYQIEPNFVHLDTNYQNSLPQWRKVDQDVLLNLGFAIAPYGSSFSLKTNFTEDFKKKDLSQLDFLAVQDRDTLYLAYLTVKKNQTLIQFDSLRKPTEIFIRKQDTLLGSLTIDVFKTRQEKAYIIPLFEGEVDEDKIQDAVNKILNPYELFIDFEVTPGFYSEKLEGDSILNNPVFGFDHYTSQMREIRSDYFQSFPNYDKKAYYIFLHAGFLNDSIQGYSVKGKALSFIKRDELPIMSIAIARELLRGIGGLEGKELPSEIGVKQNIFEHRLGTVLNPRQWRKIHKDYRRYSYFDEDEEIHSLNGFVAYYFWEEDDFGFINFRPSDFKRVVQRPYKKNYFSYHFSIEKRIFKPLFSIYNWAVAPINFILTFLFLFLAFIVHKKGFLERLFSQFHTRNAKRISKMIIAIGFVLLHIISFVSINKIMKTYVIFDGVIPDFENLSTAQIRRNILHDADIERTHFPEMASEVLIKRGSSWLVKRRKRVLYFDLYQDTLGYYTQAKFNRESDSIILNERSINVLAPSHYFVLNFIRKDGSYESQKVFNYKGKNVTQLLSNTTDPAKRILLFVNGYRPTSLGNSLEENFSDILKKGVEYPDSKNLIDTSDTYGYWTPWNEIDKQFIKRINPSATYYADGHFSVSTSNYRSLIHFTQVSTTYPKRCEDPENHICTGKGGTTWFRSSQDRTELLLPTRPNYEGFEKRKSNGRIAGMNLFQELNEIPNDPSNDTLYIICHSMGYAYALGMIEELRDKINFGKLYIIAPENALAGKVNPSEWREVWQYGVNHQALKRSAPCMLDGVAPQTRAAGLEPKHQIFIPEDLYRRFGFFDSHFIGYYDWILTIPKNNRGHMQQN